jgi:hypothetical protein
VRRPDRRFEADRYRLTASQAMSELGQSIGKRRAGPVRSLGVGPADLGWTTNINAEHVWHGKRHEATPVSVDELCRLGGKAVAKGKLRFRRFFVF